MSPPSDPPVIQRDPRVISTFLTDAAHVAGGFAAGIAFPAHAREVPAIVAAAERVLPIGAQSSLTGGATPRGDIVLSTRALTSIDLLDDRRVRVGAGVPLVHLQQHLAGHGLYYPPVPTFDGAFVGGTIATNAAGAATFKYGSTRQWVDAIAVVLAGGAVLEITRGQVRSNSDNVFEIVMPDGGQINVPGPRYTMPSVPKVSAGYYAAQGMDLIDLFIGSEGTLGIITNAVLRVIPRPRRALALVTCRDDSEALTLTGALREHAHLAWAGRGLVDVSAIEYLDARSLAALPDTAFAQSRLERPLATSVLLLIQLEVHDGEDASLAAFAELLEAIGIDADPLVVAADDERGAQRLFDLREAVPAAINAAVGRAKREDDRIEKTAGDFIVPFHRLADALAMYRAALETRRLDYAIWGHASDGNLHVNVVPGTMSDVTAGRDALIEMAREVVRMGGSPLAEHGVGRSAMKQRLLKERYGEEGIEQMRAVKRALDPGWKLSPGVLFPAAGEQEPGGGAPDQM
jgi:D-lactate dehydrogenase (cytochrome)